jgi:hypothetical protein
MPLIAGRIEKLKLAVVIWRIPFLVEESAAAPYSQVVDRTNLPHL